MSLILLFFLLEASLIEHHLILTGEVLSFYWNSLESYYGFSNDNGTLFNISDSTYNLAGELFIYLNYCPRQILFWKSFYENLFLFSPPSLILSTINRLIVSGKSEYSFIYKLLLEKMTDIFNLKYDEIKNTLNDTTTLKGK